MGTVADQHMERLLKFIENKNGNVKKEDWMSSLSSRKREEATFHDWSRDPALRAGNKIEEWKENHPNKRFYDTAEESFEHSRRWIQENSPGKVVLDFACGDGANAMQAAQCGAALAIGIDISPVSIENCRQTAALQGLDQRTYFLTGDCEDTGLPSDSVDRIICMGCLHHLDLSYAFPELRRILRPGGKIHVMEALAYNPLIQLYRRMTPHLRTEWEKHHILSLREVKFARRFFEVRDMRYFHLLSLLTLPLHSTQLFCPALRLANAIDRVLLRVPPISLMAWVFSFELVKKAAAE